MLLGSVLLMLAPPAAAAAPSGAWRVGAPMIVSRSGDHSATLLKDGSVLVVGGVSCGLQCNGHEAAISSAELYDPTADKWTTTDATAVPRELHTATLLRDGRVLVTGGLLPGGAGVITASAEIYDAGAGGSGHWRSAGSMSLARLGHTATLLPDGRVLVAGGLSRTISGGAPAAFTWEASAELYDPETGRWSPAGSMGIARAQHTATLLHDGRVLVAGGRNSSGGRSSTDIRGLKSAEIYNPATDTWKLVPHLLHSPRVDHTATLLDDGSVVLTGGATTYYHGGTSEPTGAVEVFHPEAGTLTDLPPLPQPRLKHSATLLSDGRILVVAGILAGDNVREGLVHHTAAAPELLDLQARAWSPAPPMPADPSPHGFRSILEYVLAGGHTATLLPSGRVLVVGGDDSSRQVQLFDPGASGRTETQGSRSPTWAIAAGAAVAVVVAGAALALWRRRRR